HDWIFDRLSRTGPKTQAGLAKALSVEHPQVTQLKQFKRDLKVREVPAVAKYLEAAPPPWPRSAKAKSKPDVLSLLRQIDIPDESLEVIWAFIPGYLSAGQPPQDPPHGQSEPASRRREEVP